MRPPDPAAPQALLDRPALEPAAGPYWSIFIAITALAAGGLAYLTAGPTLGFFVGGVAFSAILVPSLLAWRWAVSGHAGHVLATAALVSAGISVSWLALGVGRACNLRQWLACAAVVSGLSFAQSGAFVALVRAARLNVTIASTLTALASIAWLTWPIWLSARLTTDSAAPLVAAHPILVVNGVLPDLGAWTHQGITYELTALGQDIAYELPRTIANCVIVHSSIAVIGMALGLMIARFRGAPRAPGG